MIKLETYEDWKACITVACGLQLTLAFVEERLMALRDPTDFGTQRFLDVWGENHRRQVVAWFERARAELGTGISA